MTSASSFPTALDTFVDPNDVLPGHYVWMDGTIRNGTGANAQIVTAANPALIHENQHILINDAVAALEAKVGINGSVDTSSIDYKLRHQNAPGGPNGSLQWNNSGAFGGISGITTNGFSLEFTNGSYIQDGTFTAIDPYNRYLTNEAGVNSITWNTNSGLASLIVNGENNQYAIDVLSGESSFTSTSGFISANLASDNQDAAAYFSNSGSGQIVRIIDGFFYGATIYASDSNGNSVKIGDNTNAITVPAGNIQMAAGYRLDLNGAQLGSTDITGEITLFSQLNMNGLPIVDQSGGTLNIESDGQITLNPVSALFLTSSTEIVFGQITYFEGHTVNMGFGGNVGGGTLSMDSGPAINFLDPTNGQDAATKNYVDTTTSPAPVGSSNSTANGAAIGTTTIFTPATAGTYRVSFVAKVTRAGAISSVLGGAGGFQVTYTDKDDSVVVTTGAVANDSGLSLSLNTTQAMYSGSVTVNAKASTNIQFAIGYTSAGTTTMQYNLHVRVEKL